MTDGVARAPTPVQFLLWDGTDPVDSFKLGNGLQVSFRCLNLLDDSPASEEFVSSGAKAKPRTFLPAGPDGTVRSVALWERGMFEFPLRFFDPTHHNAGDDRPHILQFSGHGIPGFMFAESSVLVAASNPITGTASNFSFSPRPWNNPNTKVAIFSACRQLAGGPQQHRWANAMRGKDHRVHTILSYRNTAPAAKTSAKVNRSFLSNLRRGQTFVTAWKNAHKGMSHRWGALCYESAVGDRLDEWVKSGSLASAPNDGEDILYFDSKNLKGRVVTKPTKELNCRPVFRSSARDVTPPGLSSDDIIPPWSVLRPGTKLSLQIDFRADSFQTGDVVWLVAMQVRPDYHGPFEIENLFTIDATPDPVAAGKVFPLGRVHDVTAGWKTDHYSDLYEFVIDRAGMSWLTHDNTWKQLTIPIKIEGRPNDHLPVFYIMLRVDRPRTGQSWGVPTKEVKGLTVAHQRKLVDDFQFCAFLVAA